MGSTLACCFGTGFCSLCCSACPSCKGSTSTRLVYSIFLFACLTIFFTMLTPDIRVILKDKSHLRDELTVDCAQRNCTYSGGFRAVYRLSLGTTIFFGLLSILMIRVKTSSDRRAKIQNGFWAIKFLILVGLISGTLFIPVGAFDSIWRIFGLVGGGPFIPVQLFLLVDFVHKWNESWVDRVQSGSKKHGYGLLFATFIFYIITLVNIILLYEYYGKNHWSNYFFLSFNLCLCIGLSIISILPVVRRYNSSCGLLQSSFVGLYVLYFTWSAMSDALLPTDGDKQNFPIWILGLIIFVFTILYSVLTPSRNNRARKLFFAFTSNEFGVLDDAILVNSIVDEKWVLSSDEDTNQRVYDDERGSVCYNYSAFHLMFVSATFYLMMSLTSWYSPNAPSSDCEADQASLWVKMIATWFSVLLYIWSCIAPAVFPNRDFS